MQNTINIGTIINLDDLIKSRALIQANSGGGKSTIARVIMEESYGKVPFIVMDIDGEYYTLKELYGDIIVIGGQHADVPISMELAKPLAKFIIENGLNVVIDVSDLEMNQRIRFVRVFIESLMSLPQQYWVNYLIFLEECHKLAGEQDKHESGPAVKDLLSRGRKRGYCGIPITQRISKLHKDVAAECNNKFIGRTYLDIDMDRSAKELGFSKQSDRLKLRDLQPGHFYAFGTSIEPHEVHEVKINMPKTKMPSAGTGMSIKIKVPTAKVLSVLGKLNELPKEAAKELKDMQDLQREVIRLESELSKKLSAPQKTSVPVSKDPGVIADLKNQLKQKDSVVSSLAKAIKTYEVRATSVSHQVSKLIDTLTNSHGITIPAESISMGATIVTAAERLKGKTATSVSKNDTNYQKPVTVSSNSVLGKCSREVIRFLSQYPDRQFSKAQVAIATGYSPGSGGFNNSLSELHKLGYILRSGKLQVNTEALDSIIGSIGEIHQQDYNIETYKNNLGKCEREIYEVLLANPEKAFTKDEISQATETTYSAGSGGFNNSLSRLNTLELIDRRNGVIKLNPELLELMS